jgi:hypothetical protein
LAYSEEYFINVLGEQKGPYTFPQLKRMYETNLIPEETLYWQDGMEQWQSVADLCGSERRKRRRRLKRLRGAGAVFMAVIGLLTAYCAPVFQDGWRELNDRDQTADGAYWKARGFVREEVKAQDASVAFEPFKAATVTISGSNATVVLPGTLFAKDGSGKPMTWKVAMHYDVDGREWRLPAGAL